VGLFDQFRSIFSRSGPVHEPDETPAERRLRPRINPREGSCILVVDDSPTILKVLKRFLESAHCVVLEAPDAKVGLELALTHRPALIFLDIVMPGINGFAALRALRKNPRTRETPIIMMSGNEQATAQFFGSNIGADDFMKKPFSRFEVFARVERLLDQERIPRRVFKSAEAEAGAAATAPSPAATPSPAIQASHPQPEQQAQQIQQPAPVDALSSEARTPVHPIQLSVQPASHLTDRDSPPVSAAPSPVVVPVAPEPEPAIMYDPVPDPVSEHTPEHVPAPMIMYEPVSVPEPKPSIPYEPVSAMRGNPMSFAEPAIPYEPVPNVSKPAPAPMIMYEPVSVPEPEPVSEPEPAIMYEPVFEPEPPPRRPSAPPALSAAYPVLSMAEAVRGVGAETGPAARASEDRRELQMLSQNELLAQIALAAQRAQSDPGALSVLSALTAQLAAFNRQRDRQSTDPAPPRVVALSR
jgi:twitching motility two-component system response regulator PilH